MTELVQWLMSERPQSRRQAAFGRAYGAWRAFSSNHLAVAGLLAVLALVLVAAFANQLAPYPPTIGDLRTERL
ncbi:MAG TPA: D,D-dipeptide ABC transporter permease, partial [Burkholderiaceae bacterium]|nr:D,D-dipeptide ABC transporter permease [Burkholderiaceae bacterium]